jgi:hypothetical protein
MVDPFEQMAADARNDYEIMHVLTKIDNPFYRRYRACVWNIEDKQIRGEIMTVWVRNDGAFGERSIRAYGRGLTA